MTYVDGFLLVVPKNKVEDYKKMAAVGLKLWTKYGALDYKECIGDDLNLEGITPFNKLVKLKKNETVWFSFATYKSKEHRDKVIALVMADPEMSPEKWKGKKMPFDMKRMSSGGFKVIIEK